MNFGGGGGGGSGGSGAATAGPDLQETETEQLAFQTASGEDRLRLLPSPWPTDNLPPNTASLLSVAQTKGLIAAASPNSLVIASTDSVRSALTNAGEKVGNIKAFTPQATIPIPRISQVAFSSDESCLVIAAEQGGGLAVYDTNSLTNGGKEPAFQLATEGQSVRQVLPNPNPSADLSRYFGLVTENGQLLLADLKEQKLVQTSVGSNVFHEKVSCACWSRLGKQIVAGLADGTAVQIDPRGVVKATIPEPPQLAEWKQQTSGVPHPITSILWLDTYDFLIIHTPFTHPSDSVQPESPDSIYHLAHRDKQTNTVTFSKFIDPCPAFGMESRKPAHHFILRLRDWLSLSDLLILSSTASSDIGLFTRAKQPLDPTNPITDSFTHTRPPDSRRPAMPMGVEGDTSPIGMAVDLSVKEKIPRPIPTDETIEEAPVPLPAVLVLDNEGGVSLWYVVFSESVKKGEVFGDLVVAGGPRALGGEVKGMGGLGQVQSASGASAFGANNSVSASSGFGQQQQPTAATSTFGAPGQTASAFGQPSAPGQSTSTFGQSSTPGQTTSAFGQPSGGAFGSASALGMRQSPWSGASNTSTTSGAAFGKPAFGSSTFGQPSTFGQVGGGMGMNKGSVWGTPQSQQQQQGSQQQPTSTFGSSSSNVFGGNTSQSSPFMNLGGNQGQNQNASPFASAGKTTLSNQSSSSGSGSGFASSGQNNHASASPFATAASNIKPALSTEPSGSTVSFGSGMSFGSGSTNFGVQSLGSPTPTPTTQPQAQAQSREETMDDNEDGTTSDTSTLKPGSQPTGQQQSGGIFGLGSGGFKLGSTFKADGSAKDDLPKPKDPGAGLFGEGFGKALGETTAAEGTRKPQSPGSEAAWMSGSSTPVVKKEPGTEEGPSLRDIPAAQPESKVEAEKRLPKVMPVDDAPLPPDPATFKPKPGALPAPVPPGFEGAFGAKRDAPLSSEPAAKTSESQAEAKPFAGSPPVDLGSEKFSEGAVSPLGSEEAAGPPENEDDEGEWRDEEEDDNREGDENEDEEEGSEEDHDQDHTPQAIQDPKGLSAFEARLTPADSKKSQSKPSPSPTQQVKTTTPATEPKKDSYTPAGMPKAPVIFQPPQPRGQESPRSPSPQRSATSPARAMPPSFGSVANASSGKGVVFGKASATTQQPPLSQPSQLPPPSQPRTSTLMSSGDANARSPSQSRTPSSSQLQHQQPQRIAVPPAQLQQSSQQRPTTPAKPSAPTEGELEDEEDARIQAILAAPIEPVTEVPSFLAHQDYIASGTEKEGLGGQIERVFRDINSMIDTLALNARGLRGFVEGNGEQQREEEGRGRLDLEEEDSWVLGEAGQLDGIIEGIEIELEDGKLEDVKGAVEGLMEEEKEVVRMRGRCAEMRRVISARGDPEQQVKRDSQPLDMQSQALQSELRQGVLRLQGLLAKAEEGLSLLRAELASSPSKTQSGRNGVGLQQQQPTVEAVTNTILKMTAMVEQRSGDIDVLESKIRRLGGPAALGLKANYEDDLAASMMASRLSQGSPSAFRSSKVGMYGSPVAARLRASVRASPSPGGFGKKSLFDVDEAEVEAYRAKREGRRRAMERLREQVEVRGPRVVKVGR